MQIADPAREPPAPSRRRLLAASAGAVLLAPLARAADAEPALRIQRLGWAGIHLQAGSDHLYIDPLLDPAVWGQDLREPLSPIETQAGQRFVLVTHRHPDHFDPLAVKAALGDEGTFLSPEAVNASLLPPGSRARVATLYEPQLLGGFTAVAVPAADGYGDPQVSWIVSAGGRRIIHCGDTLWHGHWWKIGRQYGPFDAAFLPINGARFGWRKPVSDVPAVLTPREAVAAAVVIGARLVVPIHYGIAPSDDYREVADARAQLLAAARERGVAVEIVPSGGWMTWKG
jgi:L-ascorbate metabolism protein UlaG (beta-lactamase superfamily)